MKKTIKLILSATVFFALCVNAQEIEKLYINMPDGLSPSVSKQQRLELIEYYKAGQQADSIKNKYGKTSKIILFENEKNHLKVQTSATSTSELFLYTEESSGDSIIGLIRTVCLPICYSYVSFFDNNWQAIDRNIEIPRSADWIKTDCKNSNEVETKMVADKISNISFVSLSYDTANQALKATNNTPEYLPEEEKMLFQDCLNSEIKEISITSL